MYHYVVILMIAASLSIFLPLGIGIYRYKSLQIEGRIVFGYLCLSFLIMEVVMWYTVIKSMQNHYLLNAFYPIEFLMLSSIYWITLKTPLYKKIILCVAIVIITFIIGSHIINLDNFNRFNSVANAVANLGLMFFVILYFYELLKELHIVKLSNHPMFWISVGIILYVSINFFLFIFGEFVMFNSSKEISKLSLIITSISTIIFRIFLTIGLWFSKTPIQSNLSLK
jgi:hypothetical protein